MERIILILTLSFVFISCKPIPERINEKKTISATVDSSRIIKDDFDDIIKYSFYNEDMSRIDSVKYYYSDLNKLKSVDYYVKIKKEKTNYYIQSIGYYETGEVEYIRYDAENQIKQDTLYIRYYKNGYPEIINIIESDSLMYPQSQFSYFENGMIREKGLIDIYNTEAMPIGQWEKYDSLGSLIETTYYHPDKEGRDYIIIKSYSEGKLVSEKKFNNYVQYESDPIEKE